MNLVMLVALALAFIVLSWIDAGVIAAVIVTNTAIGFTREYKAEKTMAALRNLAPPTCVVLRDGETKEIVAQQYALLQHY